MTRCSQADCQRTDISARGLCSRHYQLFRYRGTLDTVVPPTAVACRVCGKPLLEGHQARKVFCSAACKERDRTLARYATRQHRYAACENCGSPLDAKRTDAKFCSAKCGDDYHNAQTAAATRENRKPCAGCGQPLPLKRWRFCSPECKRLRRRSDVYGLTQDELVALLAQHTVCAICGTDRWGRKGPQIDHDHATGAVRGVLCTNCNTMLGHANDNPARLRLALAYLEAHTSS